MASLVDDLREAIAGTIAGEVKAYNVPKACEGFHLSGGTSDEAFGSKRLYVLARLPETLNGLFPIAERVLQRFPNFRLEELMWRVQDAKDSRLSELTRRGVLDAVTELGHLGGRVGIVEFLNRFVPLDQLPSDGKWLGDADQDVWEMLTPKTLADDVSRHMVQNDDWDCPYLFERLGLLGASERRFMLFLEQLVHPVVREPDQQTTFVEKLNDHLLRDGVELRAVDQISGYPVYRAVPRAAGVAGNVKNLIFAANGPKPEIILADAINNDIRIVKNGEFSLIYDRALPPNGLLWNDLVAWWASARTLSSIDEAAKSLGKRLLESLGSPPEQLLFGTYFKTFKPLLGARLPALIPQVYLHFDPLTIRELAGERRLPRQRMDFLLLLSSYERIVIEVDGKQHYAAGDLASPSLYAEMAAADRQLRLLGYEVYRFGGQELGDETRPEAISDFFTALFKRHRVLPS